MTKYTSMAAAANQLHMSEATLLKTLAYLGGAPQFSLDGVLYFFESDIEHVRDHLADRKIAEEGSRCNPTI